MAVRYLDLTIDTFLESVDGLAMQLLRTMGYTTGICVPTSAQKRLRARPIPVFILTLCRHSYPQ
jgi:hypothetical protein